MLHKKVKFTDCLYFNGKNIFLDVDAKKKKLKKNRIPFGGYVLI